MEDKAAAAVALEVQHLDGQDQAERQAEQEMLVR